MTMQERSDPFSRGLRPRNTPTLPIYAAVAGVAFCLSQLARTAHIFTFRFSGLEQLFAVRQPSLSKRAILISHLLTTFMNE
jgi:hypothetical protein